MSTSFNIIPDKLIFECVEDTFRPPTSKYLCFSIDNTLQYTAFFADFGPLDLGLTYTFCNQLEEQLKIGEKTNKQVLFYCSKHPHRSANAAVLICSFLIFVLGWNVEDSYRPFIGISPPFTTFRDAAFCVSTYAITILDCARSMYRAVICGHFSYNNFNLATFKHINKLENGDLSWIVPRKFVAFSGPLANKREISSGVFALSPEEYVPILKSLGVTCIVRFNSKCYDRGIFIAAGIKHVDLYYEDGGNPSDSILNSFIQLCEGENGAIAVHCKAGLGRTGTNIAAYMMKHYGYTAKETIAWCRICRPGSVVGPQQQYLATIEARMWSEGERYRANQLRQSEKSIRGRDRSGSGASINSPTPSLTSVSTYNSGHSASTTGSSSLSSSFNDDEYDRSNVLTPPLNRTKRSGIKENVSLFRSVLGRKRNEDGSTDNQRPNTSNGELSDNRRSLIKKKNEERLHNAINNLSLSDKLPTTPTKDKDSNSPLLTSPLKTLVKSGGGWTKDNDVTGKLANIDHGLNDRPRTSGGRLNGSSGSAFQQINRNGDNSSKSPIRPNILKSSPLKNKFG